MTMSSLIAVAGPSGSGKTTWISQFLKDANRPSYYLASGAGNISVDLARIAHRFPWVRIIPENKIQSFFENWAEDTATSTAIYWELGFHLVLEHPFLSALPWRRVAVLPPQWQGTEWCDWADVIIPGNHASSTQDSILPNLWLTSLTGQVFDPPSLDALLIEITEGAYGTAHRLKGIFELPDGQAFYVDFAQGLPGIEYTELNLPRWLEGRPRRPSGIEVLGWELEEAAIAQALLDSSLSDVAIDHYQQQYRNLNLEKEL